MLQRAKGEHILQDSTVVAYPILNRSIANTVRISLAVKSREDARTAP